MADLTGALLDLVQALSGSLGAVISTAAVFPLDKLKARLQVADAKAGASFLSIVREMTKDKGVAGMWEGAVPRMSEQACTKFISSTSTPTISLWSRVGDAKRVGLQ